jgi:hypothetical protein
MLFDQNKKKFKKKSNGRKKRLSHASIPKKKQLINPLLHHDLYFTQLYGPEPAHFN